MPPTHRCRPPDAAHPPMPRSDPHHPAEPPIVEPELWSESTPQIQGETVTGMKVQRGGFFKRWQGSPRDGMEALLPSHLPPQQVPLLGHPVQQWPATRTTEHAKCVTEELNFRFHFICINFNLNSHAEQVASQPRPLGKPLKITEGTGRRQTELSPRSKKQSASGSGGGMAATRAGHHPFRSQQQPQAWHHRGQTVDRGWCSWCSRAGGEGKQVREDPVSSTTP